MCQTCRLEFIMRIEKINDNQIKCTLNRADLINHQIKISELAYGTDNAKELFRDMMEEASEKFGFEVDDIPLMIEAIPVSPDCIVLLITKVDNPEELDEKLAKFSPSPDIDDSNHAGMDDLEDFSELFPVVDQFERKYNQTKSKNSSTKKKSIIKLADTSLAIYDFSDLNDIINVCKLLDIMHLKLTSLYYSSKDELYYLVLNLSDVNKNFIPAIRNTLSEFGNECTSEPAIEAYFKEHCDVIIVDDAISKLATI